MLISPRAVVGAVCCCGLLFSGAPAAGQTIGTGNTVRKTPIAPVPLDPEAAERHYKVARVAMADKNFTVAKDELELAARQAPSNALIHYNLAIARWMVGAPDGALISVKEALRLGLPPEQRPEANELLRSLMDEREKAGLRLYEAPATDPRSGGPARGSGPPRGESAVRRATVAPLQLPSPDNATTEVTEAELHYKVALAAMRDKNLAVAKRELEAAAKLAPSNALVHYILAVVQQQLGAPDAALVSVREALRLGLPPAERAKANELLPALMYEREKAGQAVSTIASMLSVKALAFRFADSPGHVEYETWEVERASGQVLELQRVSNFINRDASFGYFFYKYVVPIARLSPSVSVVRGRGRYVALLVRCADGSACITSSGRRTSGTSYGRNTDSGWTDEDPESSLKLGLLEDDEADAVAEAMVTAIKAARGASR